jgi:hypothetical protein
MVIALECSTILGLFDELLAAPIDDRTSSAWLTDRLAFFSHGVAQARFELLHPSDDALFDPL